MLMRIQDGSLNTMDLKQYKTSVDPKVTGTQNLLSSFPEIESFVMFSSAAGIVGNRGQANYASGCTFQDAVANNTTSKAHIVSLNLPLIGGSNVDLEESSRRHSLFKQGLVPITLDELFLCLDYALSTRCRTDGVHQIVVGLSEAALKGTLESVGAPNPLFSHLISKESNLDCGDNYDRLNAHLGISAEMGIDEIHARLTTAIANRISALIAIEYVDIEFDTPILEFGLDSLVAIELKNWITRTFQTTTIDTAQILGMSGIKALAVLVAERSSLVTTTSRAKTDSVQEVINIDNVEPTHGHSCCKRSKNLAVQPLLDLDTLFDLHLTNHRAIWTDEE